MEQERKNSRVKTENSRSFPISRAGNCTEEREESGKPYESVGARSFKS